MSGEPIESIQAQLGYLTGRMEMIHEDVGQFMELMKEHAAKDERELSRIDDDLTEIKEVLNKQKGAIQVLTAVAIAIGTVAAWVAEVALDLI